jgi:hypothetical protein
MSFLIACLPAFERIGRGGRWQRADREATMLRAVSAFAFGVTRVRARPSIEHERGGEPVHLALLLPCHS